MSVTKSPPPIDGATELAVIGVSFVLATHQVIPIQRQRKVPKRRVKTDEGKEPG